MTKVGETGILVNKEFSPTVAVIGNFAPEMNTFFLRHDNTASSFNSDEMDKYFIPGDSIDFIMMSNEHEKVYYGYCYQAEDDNKPYRSNAYQDPIAIELFYEDEKLDEELEAEKMHVGEHSNIREAAEELINVEMHKDLSTNIHRVSSHREAMELFKQSNKDFLGYIILRERNDSY